MWLLWLSLATSLALDLDQRPGDNETRIVSAVTVPAVDRTVKEQHLFERLGRLDYQRVETMPDEPGEYARIDSVLWVYRNEHTLGRRRVKARLFGVSLRKGRVTGGLRASGAPAPLGRQGRWLEPELLAESFQQDRAVRERVLLSELPEHVWQPLLALEDARFFGHLGVDAKALLRAALRNAKAGETVQGGSTLTQQLVKNRDLSSRRTLSRKASEAVRALALEVAWSKEQILQSYLNTVYYGHVDGVGVYGLGAASRVYFGKAATELTLPEAATLAAVVQGPNGLSPLRHAEAATERRNRAITRMEELDWLTTAEAEAARGTPLTTVKQAPVRPGARHLRSHLYNEALTEVPGRLQRDKGLWVQSTVDPWLQDFAEDAVTGHLDRLRRDYPLLARLELTAALVLIDARTGAVLAQVGGDPDDVADELDRVTRARRQPGSLVKPFVIAEALDDCGRHNPLHAATWVSDEPLTVDIDGVPWTPGNYDKRSHGDVMLRDVLVQSYNVPVVRIADWCGWDDTARRVERAGLALTHPVPPSFVLGAVEQTPWQLAGAYAAIEQEGRRVEPHAFTELRVPGGRRLARRHPRSKRVMSKGTAVLTRELLEDVVEHGTGKNGRIDGVEVAGKTGTSNNLRDAWFVGSAEGVVALAWVGLDGSGRVGLTGGSGAAPLVADVLAEAVAQRAAVERSVPRMVRWMTVDAKTGYTVPEGTKGGVVLPFRWIWYPGKKYFWRKKHLPALGSQQRRIEVKTTP